MAVNPNNLLGQSNPNGTVGVSLGIDPAGANEAFSAGATSGFYVTPTSPAGMSVQVGGAVGVIDSALVRSASGITFPVGNITGTPITLTVPAAPSTNSRIDSVVLYVDTAVTATATDGANAVGMEIVSGTSASSPVPPTDQQIRSAIQDGASIAYTVLANITVSSSTSTITASNISQANRAQLAADKIDFATYVPNISFISGNIAQNTSVNFNNWNENNIGSTTVNGLVVGATYLVWAHTQYTTRFTNEGAELRFKLGGTMIDYSYISNGWSSGSYLGTYTPTATSVTAAVVGRGDWTQRDSSNKCRVGATNFRLLRVN